MKLTDEDVREILRIIDESALQELRIETEGFSLHVRRGAAAGTPPPAAGTPPPAAPGEPATPGEPAKPGQPKPRPGIDGPQTIGSPMLGTFYRAEGPGQEPFVEVGDEVSPDSTVCIIEVMKMMNSVAAGVAGTIVEVCPDNGELVEPGAPLFRVQPAL